MEFSDIKIFYEVATLNSTVKVANKLGYDQSNISKRIAKLEAELNKKLFLRTNKGMSLTIDGKNFFPYAEDILSTILSMEKNFLINNNQLRLGATQSISKNYLRNYYLNPDITIFTKTAKVLQQDLFDCNLDFIIVTNKIVAPEIKEIQIISEKISWIKSKTNTQNFTDNMILISRDSNCVYRKETFNYF